MEKIWNHKLWSREFIIASKKKEGFRELRADVFWNTVEIVKQGYYQLEGEKISIKKCNPSDTILYDTPISPNPKSATTAACKVEVLNADCLEVAQLMDRLGYKTAVLNMASRRYPGGGVLEGAGAQEENISRRTNLYTSLFQYIDFLRGFDIPRNPNFSYPLDKNYGAVYSPKVSVFRATENAAYKLLKTPFQTAIISVSAISRPDLYKEGDTWKLDDKFIEPTKEKIRIILRLAIHNAHDCLILSAFGCGAYRNPPKQMANLFKAVFAEAEFKNQIKLIIFAIIDDHNTRREHNPDGNYIPFLETFDYSPFSNNSFAMKTKKD